MNRIQVTITTTLGLCLVFLLLFTPTSADSSPLAQCRGNLKKDPCGRCVSISPNATFGTCVKGYHWKLVNNKCQCVPNTVPGQCKSGYKKATDACGRTKCIPENSAFATCASGYQGKVVNNQCKCVKAQ